MSTNTTYCEICQQSVNLTAIYKHRQSKKHKQNAENQQKTSGPELTQSTISLLDSPDRSLRPLPLPLIPVPASKVYKKLENNRIETFLRKLNQRLENIVKKEN